MGITEGMVVVVSGKMDTRIRETPMEDATGTVWFIHGNDVAVLLVGGDIWHGPKHGVYKMVEEHPPEPPID